jgi:hypothetical protein
MACLVAGHLAERLIAPIIDPTELLISQRATDQLLIKNQRGHSDLDQVVNLLNEVNLAQLGEITTAETTAQQILEARSARLKAVEDALEDGWLLKGKRLMDALNT